MTAAANASQASTPPTPTGKTGGLLQLQRSNTTNSYSSSFNQPARTMEELMRKNASASASSTNNSTMPTTTRPGPVDLAISSSPEDVKSSSFRPTSIQTGRDDRSSSDGDNTPMSGMSKNSSVTNLVSAAATPTATISYGAEYNASVTTDKSNNNLSGKRGLLMSPAHYQQHRRNIADVNENGDPLDGSEAGGSPSQPPNPAEGGRPSYINKGTYSSVVTPRVSEVGMRPSLSNYSTPRNSEMLKGPYPGANTVNMGNMSSPRSSFDIRTAQGIAEYQAGEEEDFASSQSTYVGDPDYRNLNVVENMDLYMKEQVFNIKRPSGFSPYMKDVTGSAAAGIAAMDSSNGYPGETPNTPVYIQTTNRYEKFIAVFCERVIDMSHMPVDPVRGMSNSISIVGGAAPSSPPRINKNRRDQLPTAEEQVTAAQEETRFIVLTDTSIYLVQTEFPTVSLFCDAPVPTVLRAHKIYTLW